MNYAIVKIQGKQYKVKPGQKVMVDRLEVNEGDQISLDQVLLSVDGETVLVGSPYLSEVALSAKVLSQDKGEKIRVAKYRAKSRYRKVRGHRQLLTTLEIGDSQKNKPAAKSSATKKAKAPVKTASK